MGGSKSALSSVTIIAALIALVAQGIKLAFGYEIAPADQQLVVSYSQKAVEICTTLVTIVGGIGAIYGRVRATKQIVAVAPPITAARRARRGRK